MSILRHTASMTALMLLATPLLAQVPKKPASTAEVPMIRSLSIHNPTPAYLVEAGEKANDAILQGEALLKQGHVNDAIAEYQTAMQYLPNDPLALQRIAEAYASDGRLTEASQTYHKLFYEAKWQAVGGGPSVFLGYALVLIKTHQPAEAVQMYNHGASMLDYQDSKDNGGKPFLKVLFPEVVMGDALPDQVQYTPEHLQALADAVLAHEEMGSGRDKEALAHNREAVKLFPDSAVTYYYLGETLRGFNDPGVKAAFEKAAQLSSDPATVAAAKERVTQSR